MRLGVLVALAFFFFLSVKAIETPDELNVDGFDFSGDAVPTEAAELFIEYYYGPTPDDYWIPISDIFGEEYGYMVLRYTGPEPEPPTLEEVLQAYYESYTEGSIVFADVAYENQFEYYTIPTVYGKGNMTGRFNCPVLVRYRRKADDIAINVLGNGFDIKYVYDERVYGKLYSGPSWGYIYSKGDNQIYVRLRDVIDGKDVHYTSTDSLPEFNWEYGFIEDIHPDELESYKEHERQDWYNIIEKILSYDREEWPGYEE